jgi:dTDP-glucose 4,6-dehydratase
VEWTIVECAREVLALTGSPSKLRMLPLPEDDPARRRPDITRARTVLGWEPKVQLREGLSLCIPYFTQAVQEIAEARPSAD